MKVLVVDDEESICVAVKMILQKEGYSVVVARDGFDALALFKQEKPDLVILDVTMPRIDGFETCKIIRRVSLNIPILFLSAKGDISTKKAAYRLGTDDYLTKPFHEEELCFRVDALLRRAKLTQAAVQSTEQVRTVIVLGDLRIDLARCEVSVRDDVVDLTKREFQIVSLLAQESGRVFSRDEIIAGVWGAEYTDASISIPSHVRHIREKIEIDPAKPCYLKTVMRIGYKLEE